MLAGVVLLCAMAAPEQVHLAWKADGEMWVSWLDPEVQAGVDGVLEVNGEVVSSAVKGSTYRFQSSAGETPVYQSPMLYHAVAEGLKCGGVPFTYKVGTQTVMSQSYQSKTLACVGPDETATIALIGDLGQTRNSSQTVDHIVQGVQAPGQESAISMAVLVGDLSYADAAWRARCLYGPTECNPARWDRWGNLVNKMTSIIPLMAGPGNHELEDSPTPRIGAPWLAFRERMRAPDGGNEVFWWSMEVASAHIIMMNSYMDFTPGSAQYNWLEKDLKGIDRARTPWVIAATHAPWYNSNHAHQNEKVEYEMKDAMEPLFFKYGVDILFCGHVHAYERTKPILNGATNKTSFTEINIGDGGNREVLDADPKDWIQPQPEWSAFRQNKFGHGRLYFANSTHARWSWHTIETPEAVSSDQVWFKKNQGANGITAYPIL